MMSPRTRLTYLAAAAAWGLCVASPAFAAAPGTVIVATTTTAGTTVTNRMQMTAAKLRAEVTVPGQPSQVIVFDAKTEVIWLVDDANKRYTEITKADVTKLGQQMQAMLGQLKGLLAQLPPEQRAKMEAMVGGALSASEPVTYKRVGAGKSTKWACERYEGFQAGSKTRELCTVDPKVVGLTPADFSVAEQFGALFAAVMPQARDQVTFFGRASVNGFDGVAVKTTVTQMGVTAESELTEIAKRDVPDSVFAVPADYTRQPFQLPAAAPMRMGGMPQ